MGGIKRMEKLNFRTGEIPFAWQPCHVKEIITFLKERGYQYELYKEFGTSKYILKNKNAIVFYKSSKEICEDLFQLYFEEKEEEEKEYFQKRAERDKKANKNFVMVFKK